MSDENSPAQEQAAIAVVFQDGKYLAIKRSQTVRAPGKICFPGGRIEEGESPRQAVRRELMEELGVDGVPNRQLWKSVSPWHVEMFWWLVDVEPDAIVSIDTAEVEWFKWLDGETMKSMDLLASNVEFFVALENGEIQL